MTKQFQFAAAIAALIALPAFAAQQAAEINPANGMPLTPAQKAAQKAAQKKAEPEVNPANGMPLTAEQKAAQKPEGAEKPAKKAAKKPATKAEKPAAEQK